MRTTVYYLVFLVTAFTFVMMPILCNVVGVLHTIPVFYFLYGVKNYWIGVIFFLFSSLFHCFAYACKLTWQKWKRKIWTKYNRTANTHSQPWWLCSPTTGHLHWQCHEWRCHTYNEIIKGYINATRNYILGI